MVLEYLPTNWDYFKLHTGVNGLVNIPAPWILWDLNIWKTCSGFLVDTYLSLFIRFDLNIAPGYQQ